VIQVPKFHDTDIAFLEISQTTFSLENFHRKTLIATNIFYKIGRRISEIRLIKNEKQAIEKAIDELSRKFNIVFVSGSFGGEKYHHITNTISKLFNIPLEISQDAMQIYTTYLQKNGIEYTKNFAKNFLLPRNSAVLHKSGSSYFGFHFANIICVDDSLQCTCEILEILQKDLLSGCNFLTRQIVTKIPIEVFSNRIEEFASNSDFEHFIFREDNNSHRIVLHHGNISQLNKYAAEIESILQEIANTFKVFT
jgi:hypothetical protein